MPSVSGAVCFRAAAVAADRKHVSEGAGARLENCHHVGMDAFVRNKLLNSSPIPVAGSVARCLSWLPVFIVAAQRMHWRAINAN